MQNLKLRIEQNRLLRELAVKSDCVIVGRCANYVLSDLEPLRIFIYAEMDVKIKRCKEKALTDEKLTDKELMIAKVFDVYTSFHHGKGVRFPYPFY